MYLSYYNLKSKPFQITTDPKFMWLGEQHSEALATLKYGLLEDKGFLLLTGDIGLGKTALINRLVKTIDIAAIVATIPDPGLSSIDFFNFLSEEFKMNRKFNSKGDFLIHLKQFLYKAYSAQKKVLLIVDESQRLNHELLEQIRLLSNIEMDNLKLINIFFVGQKEFNQMLMDERNKAVRQRIAVNYHLKPLNEKETAQYIRHRLSVAGATREIFSPEANLEIHSFSQGYPRLINIICDHALLTGYAAGLKIIDTDVIKECEKELHIPVDIKLPDKKEPGFIPPKKTAIAAPANPGQQRGKWIAVAVVFLLLLAFTGYMIYDSQIEEKPRWAMEEIVPQQYEGLEGKDNANLPPETISENQSESQTSPAALNNEETADPSEPESTSETQTAVSEDADDTSQADQTEEHVVMPFPESKIIIYFQHNSNDLPDEAYETLDRIAEYLIYNATARLSIKGYTDSTGAFSYNVSVSRFRANSIKSYLVGKGVNAGSIVAKGMGPENPIASNNTAAGRGKNRRVEIELRNGE